MVANSGMVMVVDFVTFFENKKSRRHPLEFSALKNVPNILCNSSLQHCLDITQIKDGVQTKMKRSNPEMIIFGYFSL